MTNTVTGENILRYWRTGSALTQSAFAEAMGVPFRTYQDLESGKTPIRAIHVHAASWAMITLASENPLKMGFLPLELAAVVNKLVAETGFEPATSSL